MIDEVDPFMMILAVAGIGIMPFILIMATSFIKIAIVLSLIRNALGVQQIPPNLVLYGLATILTFYIMAPVGTASFETFLALDLESASVSEILDGVSLAAKPFREFLTVHASETEISHFRQAVFRTEARILGIAAVDTKTSSANRKPCTSGETNDGIRHQDR